MGGKPFYPRRRQSHNTKIEKTPKQMERHLKGVANHRRIEILFLISRNEGISVNSISRNLDCNLKTIAEHTRRLALAGLVEKKYEGNTVRHKLTPYGRIFLSFLTLFSNS